MIVVYDILAVWFSLQPQFWMPECMTGPGPVSGSTCYVIVGDKSYPIGMRQWDMDRDGDIDLRDFAILEPLSAEARMQKQGWPKAKHEGAARPEYACPPWCVEWRP